jgi:WhiB family transcriptional regulator, redox-sensing transcriptional regulator
MTNMLEWQDQSVCRRYKPEVFFGQSGQAMTVDEENYAKGICSQCPVSDQCLKYALTFDERENFGVWGRTTPAERRRMKRGRAQASAKDSAATARMSKLRQQEARRLSTMGAHPQEIAAQLGLSLRHTRRLVGLAS